MNKEVIYFPKDKYKLGEPHVILNALRIRYDLSVFSITEDFSKGSGNFVITCESSEVSWQLIDDMYNFSLGVLYMITEYNNVE